MQPYLPFNLEPVHLCKCEYQTCMLLPESTQLIFVCSSSWSLSLLVDCVYHGPYGIYCVAVLAVSSIRCGVFLLIQHGKMQFICNANSAVSQTKQTPETPRFHWHGVDAAFDPGKSQTALRAECSKFILYKIPERLKIWDQMVAIFCPPCNTARVTMLGVFSSDTYLQFSNCVFHGV